MNLLITDRWNRYLDRFPADLTDIYYREEYVKLYETGEDRALCIICESEEKLALMPFLMRRAGNHFDFETAYGYGGPVFTDLSQAWTEKALSAMSDHFRENGYLCGFVRFHPLLSNADSCSRNFKVTYDRNTICILLDPSPESIWSCQISSKCRNMIRRAEKNGLEFKAEHDHRSMEEFKSLYFETMQRLDADNFYFFNDDYFGKYKTDMEGHSFLGTASLDGKPVAAALFMHYGKYGHYHLAGSHRDHAVPGTNNFLLWNAALELKKLGIEEFHLGGGTTSAEDDPLYKFKRSFSTTEKRFKIGKWVFNTDAYNRICSKWEQDNPELIPAYGNRLLKYRYKKEDLHYE